MFRAVAVLLISLLVLSCEQPATSPVTHPQGWADELRMPKAVDVNTADDVVEIFLEAVEADIALIDGVLTRMWTYNGMFPGPQIEARVGDTLVVHLTNRLPEDTTIHWHGLELPANMDGSHIAQLPVQPGQTFTYQFTLNKAATYWYHPHINSSHQVEKGLYGAIVVRDEEQDARLGLPQDSEVVVLVDDILLDASGQITFSSSADPIQNATNQANGREGNYFAVNGQVFPIENNVDLLPRLHTRSGAPVRLRLINAANARFFRLAMPDVNIYQIGGDGGLLNSPRTLPPIDVLEQTQATQKLKVRPRHSEGISYLADPDLKKGLMIVPGERADVIVTPVGFPGQNKFLQWYYHDRGAHKASYNENNQIVLSHEHDTQNLVWYSRLIRFEMTDDSDWRAEPYLPPAEIVDTQALNASYAGTLPVSFGHSLPDDNGDIRFFATMKDGVGVPFDEVTPEHALKARVGESYVWEITNLSQGDHPFHPHGFSFQWLETRYEDDDDPLNNRVELPDMVEWKDTIRVPGRLGALGRSRTVMRLAVHFGEQGREGQVAASGKVPSAQQSGGWFVHCHILEHSARGMGTYLELSY